MALLPRHTAVAAARAAVAVEQDARPVTHRHGHVTRHLPHTCAAVCVLRSAPPAVRVFVLSECVYENV